MTCQHCVRSVKELIEEVEGATEVLVSLEYASATFSANADVITQIVTNINSHGGFKASN